MTTQVAPAPKQPSRAAAKGADKPVGKTASARTVKKPPAKKPGARPVKPAVAPQAPVQPSMRFYHSQALREKTHAVLDALESAPGPGRHGDALADLVTELIEAGMDYYFMRALKQANVGFVTEQSARMGMTGAVSLISSVNRKFIVRMDREQLMVVARHIRALT